MAKRGEKNPLTGITNGKLNGYLRSAMRKIWSHSVAKVYERSVRYKKGGKFHVQCVECGLEMWIGAKKRPTNKDGSLSKRRPQRLFDVDHIDGIHQLVDPINDAGPFWVSLMTGRLRILCKGCHRIVTDAQTTSRAKEKREELTIRKEHDMLNELF